MISKDVEEMLNVAIQEARQRRHECRPSRSVSCGATRSRTIRTWGFTRAFTYFRFVFRAVTV